MAQNYMPALTGIRAVAAAMVCFHHFNPLARFKTDTGIKRLAFGFIQEMHIGVSIFFVLSGFLICYRYYSTAPALSRQWFGRYMMNRVARIYPMFLLVTLLTFFLIEHNPARYESAPLYAHLLPGERLAVFGLNLTLLKGFFENYIFTGVGAAWTLTVEECFYLGAPFFMLAMYFNRWALVWLPVACLLLGLVLVQTVGSLDFHGLFSNDKFMLNRTFLGRCLEFFAGMGLGLYVLHQRANSPEQLNRRGSWCTWLGSGLLIGMLLWLALVSIDSIYDSKVLYAGIFINNVLLPIPIVLLFYGLLTEQSLLRKLLSTQLMDTLGKSSYIFYLIHVGVVNTLLARYVIHNSVIQFILLNVISVLLYKYVESPLHQWLKPRPLLVASRA
ncbi:acyltransferase [Hymenobacter daeguensis]